MRPRKTDSSKRERTRQRIVAAAAAEFRERGINGVGLREIMKRAGLTGGGFYFHFRDKDQLFNEAARQGVPSPWLFEPIATAQPGQELRAFITRYLSSEHRDRPEVGCMMAAVGGDVARATDRQKQHFSEVVLMILDKIGPYVGGADPATRRRKAGLLMSSMAGVLTAARILEKSKSDALLAGAREFFVDSFCTP